MKYIVISDIHGDVYYAEKINEIYDKEKPDKIILLGDLYYNYKSRNIYEEQENINKIAQILNKYTNIILCTKGNCDNQYAEQISQFKFEEYIIHDINGIKFFFSHGNKYNMDNIPPVGQVVVYGHLHTGFIQEQYGIIFANAGSLSLPRNNSKNSYLVIDENNIILKDINGEVIVQKEYI